MQYVWLSFFMMSFFSSAPLWPEQESLKGDSYMQPSRSEIALGDSWDLTPLYHSLDAWEMDFTNELKTDDKKTIDAYRKLDLFSSSELQQLLDLRFSMERRVRKLYTYAHLYFDEDTKNDRAKQALQRISHRCHELGEAFSWIEPKILSFPHETLKKYAEDKNLQPYAVLLERLARLKEHTLSEREEALMASSLLATSSSHKAFSAMNDADFVFPEVDDAEGHKHSLSHGSLQLHVKSPDRTLRKNAFCAFHKKYLAYENTLAELIHGTLQHHLFESKARKYTSCLEATLFPKNIDVSVYKNLVATVRANIEPLHRYMRLRKKLLNVDALHPWDMYVPLVKEPTAHYSFEQACTLVIDACKPLGAAYLHHLTKGLTEQRWVDKFENKNKHAGAYSSGCYDSFPYILMNYQGTLRDVFTLAHEAGHSMHSLLSNSTQPFQYADYEIFVAEVASTFNEELLTQELLRQSVGNKEEQAYILNQKLEDIRGTLFRQTLFAEFELFIHEQVEKGLPITPAILKDKYLELNRFYYGEDLCLDGELAIEWARIPHFYYNFYVYQYATGISAAHALAEKVVKGTPIDREAYLEFLKSGSSLYPINLLQRAGVDMNSSAPIEATIQHFSEILDAFEALST